jgi:hypothetical protein
MMPQLAFPHQTATSVNPTFAAAVVDDKIAFETELAQIDRRGRRHAVEPP